jgi:uncharacterized Zn finger protein
MEKYSIRVKHLTFIKPVRCDNCGGNARLVRRSPHGIKGSEVRVFECHECGRQTEQVVKDEANRLTPLH